MVSKLRGKNCFSFFVENSSCGSAKFQLILQHNSVAKNIPPVLFIIMLPTTKFQRGEITNFQYLMHLKHPGVSLIQRPHAVPSLSVGVGRLWLGGNLCNWYLIYTTGRQVFYGYQWREEQCCDAFNCRCWIFRRQALSCRTKLSVSFVKWI